MRHDPSRILDWTYDIEPQESRRVFDEAGTINKGLLDLFRHIVGDSKSAQCDKH